MCDVCMCVRCTCVWGGNEVRVQLHTNRCTSPMVSYLTGVVTDILYMLSCTSIKAEMGELKRSSRNLLCSGSVDAI